jgi:DNA-binding LacI/PurR family transcriptional regulator
VNDFMAVGVLRYLREHGIRVPREISVTGFDNIRLAEFCSPSLTSVHIPRDRIGHIAFERLVAGETKSRSGARELLIDPELVVRESTGPAPN